MRYNKHVYVYHKYSDNLNTFNMLCPLNKAKVIFKGSSKNQFYFPMLNGTLSFLQKYFFLLLSFQFCINYGTCSQKCTGNSYGTLTDIQVAAVR